MTDTITAAPGGFAAAWLIKAFLDFCSSEFGQKIISEIALMIVAGILAWFGSTRIGGAIIAWLRQRKIEVNGQRIVAEINEAIVEPLKARATDGKLTSSEVSEIRDEFSRRIGTWAVSEGPGIAKQLAENSIPILRERLVGIAKDRFRTLTGR
jgi:hypothetical protein